MTAQLATGLTPITSDSVDTATDLAVVHDTSAVELKSMTVPEAQKLYSAGMSGGASAGLYPLAVVAGDVTAAVADFTADDAVDVISRWDAAFPDGGVKLGVTISKVALSPTTQDGNTIYRYTFTPRRPTHSILIIGALHGNEKPAAAALLEVAKSYYNGTHAQWDQIRGDTTLHFIPCANPDGYDLNLRTNNNSTNEVDLNRNWDSSGYWSSAWESWPTTTNDNYKGTAAHSELETQALKTLIDDTADLTAVLDVHTLGVITDVHCQIIGSRVNEPAEAGGLMWAALEAFGNSSKIDNEYNTDEPPPYLTNYCAGAGLWASTLELGQANVDVQTTAGMAQAVNWLGNSVMATARLPSVNYAQRSRTQIRYITEGQSLSLGTSTSYVDLVKFTGTSANFTTDFATDNKLTDVAHGLSDGDPVQLTTTTTLPAGLSTETTYWVINKTDDTFELSERGPNGISVELTSDGTGTHTWELVVDYGFWLPVDFIGVAQARWSFECFPGSDTGDQLYFRPYLGQNIGVFSRVDSISQTGEERYSNGGTSKRDALFVEATRIVFPSSRNPTQAAGASTSDLAFRCQYKNGNAPTGTPVLYRFTASLVLTPFNGGDSYELWTIGTSAQSQRF